MDLHTPFRLYGYLLAGLANENGNEGKPSEERRNKVGNTSPRPFICIT